MSEESEFIKGWYIVSINDDLYIRYLVASNSLQENELILSSPYETFDEAEQVLKYIEQESANKEKWYFLHRYGNFYILKLKNILKLKEGEEVLSGPYETFKEASNFLQYVNTFLPKNEERVFDRVVRIGPGGPAFPSPLPQDSVDCPGMASSSDCQYKCYDGTPDVDVRGCHLRSPCEAHKSSNDVS